MADKGAAKKNVANSPSEKAPASTPSRTLPELDAAFQANPSAHAAEYAFALLRAGRAKDAAQKLEKLHQTQPLTGRARVALAHAYFDTFRIDEAEALLKDRRQELESDAVAQRLLGELALEKDQRGDALALLKRSYGLDRRDPRTRELLLSLGEKLAPGITDDENTNPDSAPEASIYEVAPTESTRQLGRTMKKAGITAVVLLVVVAIYAWRTRVNERVVLLTGKAKLEKQKNDHQALGRAEKLYLEALDLQGGNKTAIGSLAEIYAFQFGEHGIDEAKAKLTEWAERAVDKNVPTGERFFAEGMALIHGDQGAKAEELLTKTLQKGGVDAKVFFALGEAQRAQGKFAAAKESLRRAHDLDPYHPAIALELGDLFLVEGDAKNADFYWRKAVDANPDHGRAAARALWGRVLLGEDPGTIKDKVEALAKRSEGDSPAHKIAYKALLSEVALAVGKNADAVQLAKAAQAARPDDPAIAWLVAHVWLATGSKEGLAALEGLQQKFGSLPKLTMDLAQAAAKHGKPEDGEARLAQNKELFDSARGQAFLSQLYLSGGNQAKAAAAADKALKLDEASPDALLALGRVLQIKKDYLKALESYSRALEKRQVFPEVYHQVANVYTESREFAEARKNYVVAEKMYKQSSAPFSTLIALYEDVAKNFEKENAKDAKSNAAKWRAKAKR